MSGGGDGEDGCYGGVVALQDGEVEFSVGTCGNRLDVDGFGLNVGALDLIEVVRARLKLGGGALGLVLSLAGLAGGHGCGVDGERCWRRRISGTTSFRSQPNSVDVVVDKSFLVK